MSFKVKANPTFMGTAKVHVPGEGPKALKLVFRHKTSAEADEYYRRGAALSDDGEQPGPRSYAKHLVEVVADWIDVDMPFSEEALAELLGNYPLAARAISEAYFDELGGARRGN
ncbi:phage tail assembly chaperone [Cupriavidus plantarum]|uniref:phage tail assembly chaperone n=1 Tax=Cupriavidus plantarum TaxID=942865 RepID=UPI000EAD7B26|nr:phage tail assembly chaperone [Cupriavidus plantarum]RLK45946.1 tail assembly chaperone [Cupriavidus plantarum]